MIEHRRFVTSPQRRHRENQIQPRKIRLVRNVGSGRPFSTITTIAGDAEGRAIDVKLTSTSLVRSDRNPDSKWAPRKRRKFLEFLQRPRYVKHEPKRIPSRTMTYVSNFPSDDIQDYWPNRRPVSNNKDGRNVRLWVSPSCKVKSLKKTSPIEFSSSGNTNCG